MKECSCGSRLESTMQYDARGIELCSTCEKCHKEKMRRYREEVLTDPSYIANEEIEED